MNVKVTDAEVKKSFDEQKKQSFPKDADYKKFLKTSGQTEEDILQRVKLDLLSNKIRDKVVKGKDTVSDKAIADFYNKNKARFAQPEKRDLRVVLTKDKADGRQGHGRARESGDSWTTVAKKYSIDDTSKAAGGKLPAQAKGTLDKELDDAVFSAEEERARRPDQDPVRLLRLHRHRRSPTASQQTLAEAKETIKQTLQSQNQQKALDTFVKDFTKRWKDKTECSDGYKTTDCKNGPKATPTPTAAATDPTQQVPTDPAAGPTDAATPRPPRPTAESSADPSCREAPPPGGASRLTSLRAMESSASADAVARLDELTRKLRRECPWDREQDERSIVPHTVGEAYELAAAARSPATTRSCSTSSATCSSRCTSCRCCSRSAGTGRWPRSPTTCTPSSCAGTRTSSARSRSTSSGEVLTQLGPDQEGRGRAASRGSSATCPRTCPGRCTRSRRSGGRRRRASTSTTCPTRA